MTGWQRFLIYQKERFPLAKTAPLLAVFSGASITFSAVLADRPLPGAGQYAAGFLIAMILFFQMRAADEWKDRDIDRLYRPERPIPRGLVRLRTVLWAAVVLMPVAGLAAVGIGWGVLALLLMTWLWLAAMTVEFGAPEWLRNRMLIYLASHMMIMPIMDLLLTGIEWVGQGGPAPGLWLFLALSFVNGCVLEIGRKTWAPEAERKGVESYSALWGPARSAWIWLGLVAQAALLLCGVGIALDAIWPLAAVALVGLSGAAGVAIGFARAPSVRGQSRLDAAAALWVLICYAAAGFLPLMLRGLTS
ncbi:UbiA family prenyltransferase [Mameliella alba]|nr:UbiA family prenyltransferase [Mameliella alba]MBY6169956.1 UbiA family prenyltransferase [Mameliella alba]MBY6175067.1 UbiA family prenyltransferase [Mameliella alba]